MARRVLIASLLLVAAGAFVGRGLVAAAALRPDSPFVALAVGHVGQSYHDTVSDVFLGAYPAAKTPFTNYRVTTGALPAGLEMDATTGDIAGRPLVARATSLRLAATDKAGTDYFVRADLSVFTRNESEIVPGQSFLARGSFAITQRTTTMSWTSSFDGQSRNASVMIFQPTGAKNVPLLCFHRGRGLTWSDYVDFLGHVASYGIVTASISDEQSFYDPGNPGAADPTYDGGRAELGMESGSAAQEGLMDYMLGLSSTPGDSLFGVIDPENVFIGGHSRGGGATHGSHERSLQLRAKGVIYFMAFDLRYFSEVVPPAQAPAYAILDAQPRLPSLIISAERDGDLVYPYADEIIDRATGPTTFVTVYGAIHDYLADTHAPEATATISRQDEHDRVANVVIAFIKRWANRDLSLDGMLYGSELATSSLYGVASWRRASPALMVDDFQGGNPALDSLGGAKGATGMTRTEDSVYPALGDLPSLGIRHSICQFTQATSSLDLDLNGKRDLRRQKALLVRVKQEGSSGWQVDAWVNLHDAHGNTASVQVAQKSGASTGYLPAFTAGGSPLSRFITLHVPLYAFERAAPAIDLRAIDKVSFTFGATPGVTPEVSLDDVRFE